MANGDPSFSDHGERPSTPEKAEKASPPRPLGGTVEPPYHPPPSLSERLIGVGPALAFLVLVGLSATGLMLLVRWVGWQGPLILLSGLLLLGAAFFAYRPLPQDELAIVRRIRNRRGLSSPTSDPELAAEIAGGGKLLAIGLCALAIALLLLATNV